MAVTTRRLRSLPDVAETYPVAHDHRAYGHDHAVRVAATQGLGVWLADWKGARCGADLSCGNAAIAHHIEEHSGTRFTLGDIAQNPAYPYDYHGPIEATLIDLNADTGGNGVDMFVCCETIEHLEDPGFVLRLIWHVADVLLLSTPINNFGDENAEHLWAWDRGGVTELFTRAGWRELAFTTTQVAAREGGVYHYGIWALETET